MNGQHVDRKLGPLDIEGSEQVPSLDRATGEIPILVFIRPNATKRWATVTNCSQAALAAAEIFLAHGGRYTAEELGGSDAGTSYCAEFSVDGEVQDVVVEISFGDRTEQRATFELMIIKSLVYFQALLLEKEERDGNKS